MDIFFNPYKTILVLIAATVLVCSAILVRRHLHEKNIQKAVRAASARAEALRATGITSDRMDNIWAGADQYLMIQQGMIRKSKQIPIRIDRSVDRVIFLMNVAKKPFRVTFRQPPAGQMLDLHSPQVFQSPLDHGLLVEVKQPLTGEWRMDVETQDQVQVLVRAQSSVWPISIEHAEVIAAQASTGTPVSVAAITCCSPGTPAEVSLGIRGPVLSYLKVTVASVDGTLIQTVKSDSKRMPRDLKGEYDYQLTGHFPYPHGPFRIVVEGIEENAGPFTRYSSELFQPPAYQR